jgi:hypothetical protein
MTFRLGGILFFASFLPIYGQATDTIESDIFSEETLFSEESLYESPEATLALTGIILTCNKWLIWLNDTEIACDRNVKSQRPTVNIGRFEVQVISVSANHVKILVAGKEYELYNGQSINLKTKAVSSGQRLTPS